MDRVVRFEKDGLWLYREGEKIRPDRLGVLSLLRDACEIGEAVTLLDIFRAVDQYDILKLFIQQYAWCSDLDGYHAQAEEPPNLSGEVEYLEISHHVEVICDDFDGYLDFHGICQDGTACSMSLSPLNEFAYLPVKLKTSMHIDGKPAQYCFSVLDVLYAIYDDISFYGEAKEKEEVLCTLRELVGQG